MLETIAPYNKFVAAVVGGIIAWVGVVVLSPSAPITAAEWFLLLTEVGTALGVYEVTNKPLRR